MYNKKVFGRRMDDKGLLQWTSHSREENYAHEGHTLWRKVFQQEESRTTCLFRLRRLATKLYYQMTLKVVISSISIWGKVVKPLWQILFL